MDNLNVTPPPEKEKITGKRFSIRYKLLIVFGLLVVVSISMLGLLALNMAKRAVTEKVETHLKDKVQDTAEIVDGRIQAFFQFIEGIARVPILQDSAVSWKDKTSYLSKEASYNSDIKELFISDAKGTLHQQDGKVINISNRDYFIAAKSGKNFLSEPYISRIGQTLIVTMAVPVYDYNKNVVAVLCANLAGTWLSNIIDDVVIGYSGYCYIIGRTGMVLAHKDYSAVEKMMNVVEEGKKNASFKSVYDLLQKALGSTSTEIGYYNYDGVYCIVAFTKVAATGRTMVIQAPIGEFMGTVYTLRLSIYIIGAIVLMLSIIITFLVATRMVKPIKNTVDALQGIAQGDGDLTVRLQLLGNDEITDLSLYFNQTIEKIGASIRAVDTNAHVMEDVGQELSSNMTETASSVHEISSNIDSVKQQALTQAASVTETASTIEEISRTIKQLNASIESQAASVAQSSSIEEMVANIASITTTLEKSDELIGELGGATREGKETLSQSNTVTQKIAEESGSLMEASSVIQHIASQTNLLAMNAAIEAAHAGEAGKGFAVVADEIRKLAEDSATQGKTITSTLKNLSGEIEGLSSSSKVVETKFNAIFSLAQEVKEISHKLTEAMREQENGSREVLTAIKDINSVTNEVQQGSAEMLKGSEGVAHEMEKLDGLTRVITDSMNEMAAGATQISNAVQEVAEIANKNKMSIQGLVSEVGKFKV